MQVADVNWMLSSMVQSGAALVAIVGGLLGSRYVALDAEQQAARRRLDQIEARLTSTRTWARNAGEELDNFRVRRVLDRAACYEAIFDSGGQITIDELLDETQLDDKDVPRDALESRFEILRDEVVLAKQTLRPLIGELDGAGDWAAVRRSHKIETRHDDAWEWTYKHILDLLERARRERERMSTYPFGGLVGLVPISPIFNAVDAAAMKTISPGTASRLVTAKESADSEVTHLEGELRAAWTHVDDVAQPEGFGLALSVLAYISLVSIAIPTGLMISGPTVLPQWSRILVALLFFSGVGLLLRYLFVYAAYLGKRSDREALPKSILGLLRRTRSE